MSTPEFKDTCYMCHKNHDVNDCGMTWIDKVNKVKVTVCMDCDGQSYSKMHESGFMTWEEEEEEEEGRKALKKMALKWLHQAKENEINNVTHNCIESISKIDGVSVNASWKLVGVTSGRVSYPYLTIDFDSNFLRDHQGDDATIWQGTYTIPDIKFKDYKDEVIINGVTVDMMADMIDGLLIKIKKVNYDRMFGLTERKYKSSVASEKMVFDLPNIKHEKIDVCCVCHELTRHTTGCGHYLCWQCWSNLKVKEAENENCYCGECDKAHQVCPICRTEMECND